MFEDGEGRRAPQLTCRKYSLPQLQPQEGVTSEQRLFYLYSGIK
ncbi:hypothetical protein [Thermincola potens]|nr:hypothetical protein [Thermincola potens]